MTRWLLLLPLSVPLFAQSKADDIWQRRDPRQAFLFQDNRARSVGDIVTVVVNESTNTNEREQRALDKNSDASGNIRQRTWKRRRLHVRRGHGSWARPVVDGGSSPAVAREDVKCPRHPARAARAST